VTFSSEFTTLWLTLSQGRSSQNDYHLWDGRSGKNQLFKEIIKTIEKSKLFDESVMVVVSQDINFEKIQIQIVEVLGMDSGDSRKFREPGQNIGGNFINPIFEYTYFFFKHQKLY
jgi:hypothetical protein